MPPSRQQGSSSSFSSLGVARAAGTSGGLPNVPEELDDYSWNDYASFALQPNELFEHSDPLVPDPSPPAALSSSPPPFALLSASGWESILYEGPYKYLQQPVATGATAAAYEAEIEANGNPRPCIMKVLDNHIAERAAVSAFLAELRALRDPQLISSGVIPVLLGTLAPEDEPVSLQPKLILGGVAGRDIMGLLKEVVALRAWQQVPADRVLWDTVFDVVYRAICRELSKVHRAGWIHGDLNPSNIFVPGGRGSNLASRRAATAS